MALPWQRLACVDTPEGRLELKQRGPRDFLITVDGRVLMNSTAQRSETALGRIACRAPAAPPAARSAAGRLGHGLHLEGGPRPPAGHRPRTHRRVEPRRSGVVPGGGWPC